MQRTLFLCSQVNQRTSQSVVLNVKRDAEAAIKTQKEGKDAVCLVATQVCFHAAL